MRPMLQTIIEACFTSFSHAKNDVQRQTMPAVVYPGRDFVEANDLIRRVSRGRTLYRMHLKRPEAGRSAGGPVDQVRADEIGLKRAGPRCSLARCIAPAQVWNWHAPAVPTRTTNVG